MVVAITRQSESGGRSVPEVRQVEPAKNARLQTFAPNHHQTPYFSGVNDLTFQTVNYESDGYQHVWALREHVLRQPLGLSLNDEDCSADKDDMMLLATIADEPAGCIMLRHVDNNIVKFRQMAVGSKWQKKGVGSALIGAAERAAVQAGYSIVRLHARISAAAFYDKHGYARVGDIFTEVGIPHVLMIKNL